MYAQLVASPMGQLAKVEHFPHDCCAWWKLFPWSSLRASPGLKGGWVENICILCIYIYTYRDVHNM